ncbi:MAG: 2-nitropropane dioxygenase, partial [Sphaerospermopsis kisseleviana]
MTTIETVLNKHDNGLGFLNWHHHQNQVWKGSLDCVSFERSTIKDKLLTLDQPCHIIKMAGKIGITNDGYLAPSDHNSSGQPELLISLPPLRLQQLGDPSFLAAYGVKYAYMTGAMAGGIASEAMVIALGKEKILSSFGAGGLLPERLETAINTIQQALPNEPYAFNLIHSPNEPAIERRAVDLYLKYCVRIVEASAF